MTRIASNLIFTFLTLACAGSCSKSTTSLFKSNMVKKSEPPVSKAFYKQIDYNIDHKTGGENKIDLTYLGAGGFFIRNDEAGILIDPFFSNTRFLQVPLKGVITNAVNVDLALSGMKSELKARTKAVFITHGHYDHLMDAAYTTDVYLADDTPIHTSASGVNMIKKIPGINEIDLEAKEISTPTKKGDPYDFPYAGGMITVWPLISDHAPHFLFVRLYNGKSHEKHGLTQTVQKRGAGKWKLGCAFSFLIDFKDENGEITYRMYIQSSSANSKNGWIPADLRSQHPTIDLAILGAASFGYANDYPEALVKHLDPQKIVICHWEDFFKPYDLKDKRLVRLTNIRKFVNRLNDIFNYDQNGEEMFTMPDPGVKATVKY